MSGAGRSGWVVATSIGAVEALKDQLGVCRWNYAFRSVKQRAKTALQSYYHSQFLSPPNPSEAEKMVVVREKIGRREMGLKKAMDLSCWGPTTVRF